MVLHLDLALPGGPLSRNFRWWPALAAFTLGCKPDAFPLMADMFAIEWGEVDFHDGACDDGCDQTPFTVINTSEDEVVLSMPRGHDREHICLDGYPEGVDFRDQTMAPNARVEVRASVCNYLQGELNTPGEDPPRPVEGSLVFGASGQDATLDIPWSFVPVRLQGGVDTAQ